MMSTYYVDTKLGWLKARTSHPGQIAKRYGADPEIEW